MTNYDLVARAITEIRLRKGVVTVSELAHFLAVSESHLHRTFVEWAGIPPKAFAQAVVVGRAKKLLAERVSLFEASLELGLSSPSRLYDAFLAVEGVTPGTYGSEGAGMTIEWGEVPTPYGQATLACSNRGIVGLQFGSAETALDDLKACWPRAQFGLAGTQFKKTESALRTRWSGGSQERLGVVLKGTPLRIAVWKALLSVPPGGLVSYAGVARLAGHSQAIRPVASAIAANPVALLIPCHRVIRSSGEIGEYHWGVDRKVAMLASEGALPVAI